MSVQLTVTLLNGQTLWGINYRMAPYTVPNPSVPASPLPFTGGVFHMQTPLGWVDIVASQVKSISVAPGANT